MSGCMGTKIKSAKRIITRNVKEVDEQRVFSMVERPACGAQPGINKLSSEDLKFVGHQAQE
jgi:hypothetical protein